MNATFLLTLNVGSDTDLNAIAQELADELNDHFEVIESKPWARQNLTDPSAVSPLPAPPDASGQQQTTTIQPR